MKTYEITEQQIMGIINGIIGSDMPSRWAQEIVKAIAQLQASLKQINKDENPNPTGDRGEQK